MVPFSLSLSADVVDANECEDLGEEGVDETGVLQGEHSLDDELLVVDGAGEGLSALLVPFDLNVLHVADGVDDDDCCCNLVLEVVVVVVLSEFVGLFPLSAAVGEFSLYLLLLLQLLLSA